MLKCLVISNPKVGYVQGINYIVASLLYHCDEQITYWISKALFDKYDLSEIYIEGFHGMFN